MRIALILPGFSAGDDDWAIPALLDLARGLARQHELYVFSQRYPARGVYRFANLTHTATGGGQRFGLHSLRIWMTTATAVIRQHRQTPFDLLHAFWADEAGFSAALGGAVLKRPVIVSLGGGELTYLPEIDYGAQRFLIRRLTTWLALRRAALVTAGSAYQIDLARRHHTPAEKLRLAPLGVDVDRFQPIGPPATLTPAPVVAQAASLLPVKNQALLLEIMALIKQTLPQVRLYLAGSGPQQLPLKKLAHRLALEQNILWLGALPYPRMPTFFQRAHLYLQTSHHESQGMAVLEAMACGLPALGTPVGVLRDVAAQPPAGTATTLADQALSLLTNRQLYQTLRSQACQTIRQQFDLATTTARFIALYQELTTLEL